MCINKELIGWQNVNPTLDTSLCKEPLPLNRSGETPLEVARKAGHHEEIRQVYESLGLPTTIQEQLWLARCTAAKKKIAEERNANELTRQCSSLNSYYNGLMDSSDDEDGSNEECQKRKHNPEPMDIRPGTPECKKIKYNPEPIIKAPQYAEAPATNQHGDAPTSDINGGTPLAGVWTAAGYIPHGTDISTITSKTLLPYPSRPNSYAGASALSHDSYGGIPPVVANPYAVGYPPYSWAPQGTLPGQAPLIYPTQPIMPHQPFAYPSQLQYPQQPLQYYPQEQQPLAYHPQGQQPLTYYQGQQPQAYHPQGQQPLAYHPQGQQPMAHYPQGQQPLAYHPQGQQPPTYYPQGQQPQAYHTQGQQPLAYHPQGQQPLAHYPQGQQPLAYHPQGQQPLAYYPQGQQPLTYHPQGQQPYYPTPQEGEPNHYLPQNPGQQPQ